MRPAAIIALTFAAATVAMISVGHAQNDQQQPQPKSNVAGIPKSPEDYFWPNAEQEAKLPYHPCEADVLLANGHHACLGQ